MLAGQDVPDVNRMREDARFKHADGLLRVLVKRQDVRLAKAPDPTPNALRNELLGLRDRGMRAPNHEASDLDVLHVRLKQRASVCLARLA
jgi:hypothetical protein